VEEGPVDDSAGAFLVVDGDRPGVLRLVGEFDVAGALEVRARLDGLDGPIEIDCSGVTFIDSSGLGLLVAVHRACSAQGAKLLIVDPSPRVAQLLELTGLDAALDVRRNGSEP
jgi:anti-sigma B factor antagonist